MSEGDYGASSLSTPSRDGDMNNSNNKNATNRPNNQPNTQANNAGQPTEGGIATNQSRNGINAGSCLAGPDNPKTVQRKNLSMTGNDVMVHFDERVVVHTVPYWDPCGETYYDDEESTDPRGPNCCIIL